MGLPQPTQFIAACQLSGAVLTVAALQCMEMDHDCDHTAAAVNPRCSIRAASCLTTQLQDIHSPQLTHCLKHPDRFNRLDRLSTNQPTNQPIINRFALKIVNKK